MTIVKCVNETSMDFHCSGTSWSMVTGVTWISSGMAKQLHMCLNNTKVL